LTPLKLLNDAHSRTWNARPIKIPEKITDLEMLGEASVNGVKKTDERNAIF